MLPESADRSELELADYLRVIRRRKWTVVAAVVMVVGSAVAASLAQTPVYRATAEVLLQPRTTESIFDPSVVQNLASGKQAPTEIRVVASDPVKALVRAEIGPAPGVAVKNPLDTDFLLISAESTRPERATVVANAYARAYVEYRRHQAVRDLEKAIADLEESIAGIDQQLSGGQAEPPASGRSPTNPVDAVATQDRTALTNNRSFLTSRLTQIRLAIKQKTGGALVQTPADVPATPVRPTPRRNAVVALAVGLMFGLGLAFLREYLDESIASKEDLERTLPGVAVLGLVPALPASRGDKTPVVSLSDPQSPAAESYRALRTSVQFLGVERPLRILQITSAASAEGKSTTVANLGVALAGAGLKVTIVDCDLRRPRVHEFFGMDNSVGLTSVLIGEAPLSQAVRPVAEVPNLFLLPSGVRPPNPSELLGGQHLAQLLKALEADSIVLIDCPPVLPVTDAVVLAAQVHATLLVTLAGESRQKQVRRSREVLDQVGAPIVGIVLNGVAPDDSYGYSYRYVEGGGKGRRPRRKEPLPI